MRAGDVHGTTGPDSRARRLSVRTPSVQGYFKTNPGRKVGVCRFQPKAETELRGVANRSPCQMHERRVLLISSHEGASFPLCAAFSRGGPGRAVTACLAVFTAGLTGPPLTYRMAEIRRLTFVVYRIPLRHARQDDGRLPGLDRWPAGPCRPRPDPGSRGSARPWQPRRASRPPRGRVRTQDRCRPRLPRVLHGTGGELIILLAGGDKATQRRDIEHAIELARNLP